LKAKDLARKGVLKIESYIPGRSIEEVQKEFGAKRWIKLASNENLLGPSPKAIAAIRKELPSIYLYPEGPCTILRKALAEKFAIRERRVVISNGADNLILMIANAFLNEGEEVVMADPTFSVYINVTQIMGGKPIQVKLKDFTHDLDAMHKKVNRKTKLVFICNPNNPTGTTVSLEAFDYFLSHLPRHVIAVLDEAYGDFAEDAFSPNGLDYIKGEKQVIILRTFSKVYGLAGLRIGYALGREDLVDCLYQVREPFPVHRLAQVAAVAALNDEDHAVRSIQLVYEGKRYLYKELGRMGVYVPSQANFIFIDFEKDSEEIFQGLLREGVIIRPGRVWGYPTFARVTIGRREDNRRFIKALKKVLK
jgi:histidinol-phosphate aminotransferase